jgi:hypothetical protein
MDQTTLLIISGSLAFAGILFFFIFRAEKNKPLTVLSEIAEDKKNPGFYHIFGAVSYMPDDSPSFEKYRHYLLNASDLKVIRGMEQRGSDFNIKSPFAARCVEKMRELSGRDLEIGKVINNDDLEVVEHDANESDTSVAKILKGNVIETFDTSYGEKNSFALKIHLDGRTFEIPKIKGMANINKIIRSKRDQRLFIFYSRFVIYKFGVGMLVLDLSTGNVLSDGYFRAN